MAPEAPVTWYKFGPSATSSTAPTVSYYPPSQYSGPTVVFVGRSRRESSYDIELRRARAGPDREKIARAIAWLHLWFDRRREEAERAERFREWPPARPPKARTEWGMVHRERCVHRMGND